MTEIISGTQVRPKSATFPIKKILSTIHLWIGIIFSIPFVLLGLSGSVQMIHHLPERFDAASAPQRLISDIVQAAQAVAPEGVWLAGYDAPAKPGASATVRFTAPPRDGDEPRPGPAGAGQIRITVDPDSLTAGQAQAPGRAQGMSFDRMMHDLHGRLLLPGNLYGRQVVGWLGVFMTFLGISGMVMWWPRKNQIKQAFTFKFGKSAIKTNRDMHGAFGIWGWIVFVLVSISGVYICFPTTINSMVDAGQVVREARNPRPINVTPVEGQDAMPVDEAVSLALDVVPGGIVRSVNFPPRPDQPYRIQFSRAGDYNGVPQATVIVDQWKQSVIELRDPQSNYSTKDKWLVWQRQFHAGNGLGWIWWTLVFLSGFLPLLFVITGISMWWLKRRNRLSMQVQ
jgi:uncharacterized iron-regulated membrane protein